MPKESVSSFVWRMKDLYPHELSVGDDSTLVCNPCKAIISARTLFQVKQHLATAKHKKNAVRNEIIAAQKVDGSSLVCSESDTVSEDLHQFHRDLFAMLQSARISIEKISNQHFADFIEVYTPYSMPHENTIREICLPAMYEQCIRKLKCKASNAYIWVSLNETSDAKQRTIINFVFGILGEKEENGKSYLLNIVVLTKVNEDSIVVFFMDSLHLIWPNGN